MRFDQLAGLWCVGCGRSDDGTFAKLTRSMWPGARVCEQCAGRYALPALDREADETLARATPSRPSRYACLHCGERAEYGKLWCTACEAERRRLM